MPNLIQVVTRGVTYRSKVAPFRGGSSDGGSAREPSSLKTGDAGGQRDEGEEDEFVRSTRETVMEAAIDGLVNKVG